MNISSYKIIFALLLSSVLLACSRKSDNQALLQADAMIWTQPEVALAILEKEDYNGFTDGDKAYYSLLITQARYRCGKTFNDDDDNNISFSELYYSTSNWTTNEVYRNRYARALLYHGAVYEALDSALQAMRLYHSCIEVASQADHQVLAQAYMRLGVVLYENAIQNDLSENYFNQAQYHYAKIGDKAHIATALGYKGSIYRVIRHDKAHATLDSAILFAKEAGVMSEYAENLCLLSRCLYFDSLYDRSITKAKLALPYADEDLYSDLAFNLALDYSRLGVTDSAEYWFPKDYDVDNPKMKILSLEYKIINAEKQGNFQKVLFFVREQDKINEQLQYTTLRENLVNYNLMSDINTIGSLRQNADLKGRIIKIVSYSLLSVVCLSILFFGVYFYRRRKEQRKWRFIIKKLNDENALLQHSTKIKDEFNKDTIIEIEKALNNEYIMLDAFSRLAIMGVNYKEFRENFNEVLLLQGDRLKAMEADMSRLVDIREKGLMSRLKYECPGMSSKECLLLEMTLLGFSTAQIAVCLGYGSAASVRKIKQRLLTKIDVSV